MVYSLNSTSRTIVRFGNPNFLKKVKFYICTKVWATNTQDQIFMIQIQIWIVRLERKKLKV